MNMKDIKIVIGSNFGDEGKGQMTDYFANQAKDKGQKCLVVCTNGGAQRGHTVVTPDGSRHVFHHFGSGCLSGADTYLSSHFIVNPIIFNKEYNELKSLNALTEVYVSGMCMLTTPYDMMINQIVEESRGSGKHGSCGMGIYETIRRNNSSMYMTYGIFKSLSTYDKLIFLDAAYNNVRNILNDDYKIDSISADWEYRLSNYKIINENFINDFEIMDSYITYIHYINNIEDVYDYLIFENGQGLLLDKDNIEYMPNLTPSNTGLKIPILMLDHNIDLNNDNLINVGYNNIEVCFVTRTYMTRHGAGRFDSECNKENINSNITDLTNVPNPFQDSIRYGKLDPQYLSIRLYNELKNNQTKYSNGIITSSLAITHINECDNANEIMKYATGTIDKFYLSNGQTHNDIVNI